MKTVTLWCAILWAVASVFSIYDSIFYIDMITVDPLMVLRQGVWSASHVVTSAFFYLLWKKQT